ncbi:murein DD-endopeptidase MepM/ murein hydrolase activator NlpD [Arthrobacter silviterrae]|uniref:M23 family metallopeptidase n=1 Tax=Arthrobacter TaxID=1663 RepID=UPI00277FD6AA|nr:MULTISPECIES: M23 family metallopeptidase [Arthrobacter]MDQ0278964.1 murein DD-endopeptidase MepM/ murein hydrolase activator NlpD [Arthrobacter silviterrae]
MSEAIQHGRRRVVVQATCVPEGVPASRREALAAERGRAKPQTAHGHPARSGSRYRVRAGRKPGFPSGAGQTAGIVLAATGLALAVALPSAGGALPAVDAQPALAVQSLVTAAADVPISFATPAVGSSLNLDGQLKQTLQVEAAKVTPQAAKGTLSAPLKNLVQTSPFGARINPVTGAAGDFHTGQDFAIQCSTEVFASAGGTVSYAQWHEFGGGNRVVINHGNGLSTSYSHLSSIGVKVGQKVERGDLIALSGTTGNSTGCHLHFEVLVDDETVDPQGWL